MTKQVSGGPGVKWGTVRNDFKKRGSVGPRLLLTVCSEVIKASTVRGQQMKNRGPGKRTDTVRPQGFTSQTTGLGKPARVQGVSDRTEQSFTVLIGGKSPMRRRRQRRLSQVLLRGI